MKVRRERDGDGGSEFLTSFCHLSCPPFFFCLLLQDGEALRDSDLALSTCGKTSVSCLFHPLSPA